MCGGHAMAVETFQIILRMSTMSASQFQSKAHFRTQGKLHDKARKWMWCFLAVLLAAKFYFVQQIVAAFALFTLGFVAVAIVVVGLCLSYEAAMETQVNRSNLRPKSWLADTRSGTE